MRKYTKDEFIAAVQKSCTIRETLLLLDLHPAGGSYQVFHRNVKLWGVDTSHFVTSRAGGRFAGQTPVPFRRPLEDYLSNLFPIQSLKLKKRLFAEGYLTKKCNICGLSQWLNDPIPLELHHIDGNHENNNLDNLSVLCPNCHAMTESHRKRKDAKSKELVYNLRHLGKCATCGVPVSGASKYCRTCAGKASQRAAYPSPDDLYQEVCRDGYEATGRKYGVTGNAIKRLLQRRGFKGHSRKS